MKQALAILFLAGAAQADIPIDRFDGATQIDCTTGFQSVESTEGLWGYRLVAISPCPAVVQEANGAITFEKEDATPNGYTVGTVDWYRFDAGNGGFQIRDFSQATAFEVEVPDITAYWSVRLDIASFDGGTRQVAKLILAPEVVRFDMSEFHRDGLPDLDLSQIWRVELQLYGYEYDSHITIREIRAVGCTGDLDGDGIVGMPDWLLFSQHFGEVCQ